MIPLSRSASALFRAVTAAIVLETALSFLLVVSVSSLIASPYGPRFEPRELASAIFVKAIFYWLLKAGIVLIVFKFLPAWRSDRKSFIPLCMIIGVGIGTFNKTLTAGLVVNAIILAICAAAWIAVYLRLISPYLPGAPGRPDTLSPYTPVSDDNPALKRFIDQR